MLGVAWDGTGSWEAGEQGLILLGIGPGSIPQAQAAEGIHALYN